MLSLVCAIHNHDKELPSLLRALVAGLNKITNDYELIIVDNASSDNSFDVAKKTIEDEQLPNIQVYRLFEAVDLDVALFSGVENALGDQILSLDLSIDDLSCIPLMINKLESDAGQGAGVVFGRCPRPEVPLRRRVIDGLLYSTYKFIGGPDVRNKTPRCRLMTRETVNFILNSPSPIVSYVFSPAAAASKVSYIEYLATPLINSERSLASQVEKGLGLLFSTTKSPMRIATILMLVGAFANFSYSIYILLIAIFKENVVEGWVSSSLQSSIMFFLISIVLLLISEYILHSRNGQGADNYYHIRDEFRSKTKGHLSALNVESINI